MRPIDADALIVELEKDEALFDNEAVVAREGSIKYTDNYAKIMWSRANGIRDAIVEVYDAPTIDVDRPKGEWIDEANESDAFFGIHDYICSNCNHYADDHIGGHIWYTMYKPNYCPYCGARMKGEDDE